MLWFSKNNQTVSWQQRNSTLIQVGKGGKKDKEDEEINPELGIADSTRWWGQTWYQSFIGNKTLRITSRRGVPSIQLNYFHIPYCSRGSTVIDWLVHYGVTANVWMLKTTRCLVLQSDIGSDDDAMWHDVETWGHFLRTWRQILRKQSQVLMTCCSIAKAGPHGKEAFVVVFFPIVGKRISVHWSKSTRTAAMTLTLKLNGRHIACLKH